MPSLIWRDDALPVSVRFDDPYFSIANGLAETRHVFLAGNGLPDRFQAGFRVAELGFGTGLNALAAWQAWDASGQNGPLSFTSFEMYPLTADEMSRALSHWPELSDKAGALCAAWATGGERFQLPGLDLHVIRGDANQTLASWSGRADAWFLDGFSPAKNPELWSADLMAEVARHTANGGTFATYTAAGHVRRSLEAAGFDVTRLPGFAGKRHMSSGILR